MSDTITVTGNIVTDPQKIDTPAGVPITSFRIASNQRRFDRETNAWVDGQTNFYSVSAFRQLGRNAFASLRKGDRVIVSGRFKLRAWDTGSKQGVSADIDAESLGPDLLWGTTSFTRASGGSGGAHGATSEEPAAPAAGEAAWHVAAEADDDAEPVGAGEARPF